MSSDVLTEGIELGGLTTDYEIRMLVCYLLWEIKEPVTMKMLNDALLKDGIVNYFQLANEVSALIVSNHITDSDKNRNGEALLELTELGKKAATTFYKKLPLSIREKSLNSLREAMTIERSKNENICTIIRDDDSYRLKIKIADYGSDLLSLDFYVPTEDMALLCRDNFLKDPTVLYRNIIKTLSGEDIGE